MHIFECVQIPQIDIALWTVVKKVDSDTKKKKYNNWLFDKHEIFENQKKNECT